MAPGVYGFGGFVIVARSGQRTFKLQVAEFEDESKADIGFELGRRLIPIYENLPQAGRLYPFAYDSRQHRRIARVDRPDDPVGISAVQADFAE